MRSESTAEIPLTTYNGVVKTYTLVDLDDYEHLSQFGWWLDNNGYARGYLGMVDGVKRYVQMARYLMDPPKGLQVDHMNRNRLDNRRCNLRLATRQQNNQNRSGGHGLSGHRNVHWSKQRQRWYVRIKVDGVQVKRAHFTDVNEAAAVADQLRRDLLPFST